MLEITSLFYSDNRPKQGEILYTVLCILYTLHCNHCYLDIITGNKNEQHETNFLT